VCTSNARCDAFLYCLVLLKQIHSELRELLLPLLFVDGSLYTNAVVLMLYHVSRECPSECVKQWITRTHFLNVCLQERIRGVICAGDFNYVYVFEFGILNQTIWSLARCDIVKRFEKLIEFPLWGPCTVIADFESSCVGRVCQESEDLSVPLSMSCLCVDVLYLIFDYFCHVVVRSLFHVSTMSKLAVKLRGRNVSSICPQSHYAVAVSPHFLRCDLTGDCPGVRLTFVAVCCMVFTVCCSALLA